MCRWIFYLNPLWKAPRETLRSALFKSTSQSSQVGISHHIILHISNSTDARTLAADNSKTLDTAAAALS